MTDNSKLLSSVLYKTDPELFTKVDGQNTWRSGIATRGDRVARYRRYERGEHDSALTEQMRKMLRLSSDNPLTDFNINYCRIVIDKMVSRLRVAEITSDETADNYIGEMLERNKFNTKQGEYYRAAVRDGDSYVMVDPMTLRWVSEPAYDGFSGIVSIYSPMQDQPLWACKMWSESEANDLAQDDPASTIMMKLVVYQPDRITYWRGSVNGGDVDPDAAQIAWRLGRIPIVHIANLTDNYTRYGESEIRVVLPLQDVINRTLHSMVMSSEFSAFKIAWAIGMELDKEGITPGAVINMVLQDESGNTISDLTSEQIEFLKAVKVGELSATDISQYTNQLAEITKHISQTSQTPIYGITTTGNLSGEALKQLEIGLIGKVSRFQNENIGAVQDLIKLTAQMQNTYNYNNLGVAPVIDYVDVNWKSAEIINAQEVISSILDIRERAPGLFNDDFIRQQIGAVLGLSQSQIDEEGDKAQNAQSMYLDALTGAAGNVPAVV